jgi:hypothetical protein
LEDFFEKNLILLARRQPQLAQLLREIPAGPIELFASAKGLVTARFMRANTAPIPLHSRYDPMQEARQALKKIDIQGADYFVLLGFGLGYNLDALIELVSAEDTHYFVVESDLGILKAALQARDLGVILSLPHICFAWPPTGVELARQWAAFFDPVHAQGNVFITHVPALVVNPDLFKSAAQTIQSQTFQIFTDINTLVNRSQVFLDNFVENFPKAVASPGVCAFGQKFAGIPAIIVSAGPSLDRNIHELQGCEERALILSTDTALKPLLAVGIAPHFVLTGDPGYENYLHLKGSGGGASLLVAETTAYPLCFQEFAGRIITCSYQDSSLGALSLLLGKKGTVRAWGSVATMALDFALLLGCNPVIFVGQDLAHSDGRTYCSGLHWEETCFAHVSDPDAWQKRWAELRAGKTTVTMLDIFGRPVETTDKLASYWTWFNREIQLHPDIRFVNATEGGILRDGVEVMSLREALYRFCSEDRGFCRRVQSIFNQALETEPEPIESTLAILQRESSLIRVILRGGMDLCESRSHLAPEHLLKQLEDLKDSIYTHEHLAPLLDRFNQMGNVAFLREQKRFKRALADSTAQSTIRDSYERYFDSVLQALTKIESATARISSYGTAIA